MNKKPKINLIPLFILIGILVAIYFVFLSDLNLFKINREPEVRRINGFPTVAYTDKPLEKKREIITNEQELADFLNYVDESGYLIVREDIDFNKEYLLGVSTDTNQTEGYSLKVRKIYQDKGNNKLVVSLREEDPGDNCQYETNPNVAVDLVAISKTTKKIDFERIKEVVECNNDQ
jgi:hypothetical protein